MSKSRLGLLAILLAVLTAGLLYTPAEKPEWKAVPEHENVLRHPNKLPYRFYVSDKDERSLVRFYEDNITPRLAITDMPDGLVVETSYSQTGVRTSWTALYPSKDGKPSPIKQQSTFDTDGTTYLLDKVFYRSGSLFQLGKLEAPDRFSKTYYFESGSIRRSEVLMRVGSTWHLHKADEFTAEGKLHETVRTLADGTMQMRRFKPNGKLFVKVTTSVGNASKNETWYRDDGKTPAYEVFREGWRDTVTTFTFNGRQKLEERAFQKNYGSTVMEVAFFNRHNQKTFTQRWVMEEGVYKLQNVTTLYPNELEKRILSYAKDDTTGKIYLDFETIYHSGRVDNRPHRTYMYFPDGRLTRYERSWGNYATDYSLDYAEGKGPFRPVHIDPKLLRATAYKLPPDEVLETTIADLPNN